MNVIPTGISAANIAYGRSGLYEAVVGDNSFDYLSLHDLQTKELIGLRSVDGSDVYSDRINMGLKLSTSTENAIRIVENKISDTVFQLIITVNNKMFISQVIKVVSYSKYKTVYLALLDGSENLDNHTGLLAPELRICK